MDLTADFAIPGHLERPLRAALRGEPAEWPRLSPAEVAVLLQHGVAPLLYASGVSQLRNEAVHAAAVEPLRAADLHEVLAALDAEGVSPLILKGTALAYGVYAAPDHRPRGDTDLLVKLSDLEAVRRVMQAIGFREWPASGDEHGLRQAVFSRRDGHGFVHVYDIHWAATNTPVFTPALSTGELFARAVPLPELDPLARCLDQVSALLLACIHRVAHHRDSDRLIWLVDIARLRDGLTRENEGELWRRAAAGRVIAVCERSIALADDWMSRRRPTGADDWVSAEERSSEEPSRVFLDRDITHGGLLAANLRALPWRSRLERLWQLAFPPAAFMRQRFGPRSAASLPWLYVYRWIRGVGRLFRRAG